MQRCLQLAKNGLGTTYPNPLVGSVITVDDKIIGEGWHYQSGLPHAEVNAIHAVQDQSLLKKSTLYVNLEPCSHFGKTPPCSHKIVEMGIPKVVIGTRDWASHVKGKGIEYLLNHGVEVIENVLKDESLYINKRFFTFHQKKRPYIILKWAETMDGYFAPADRKQQWITGKYTKQLVHQWRTQEQAIMIGGETVRADNPQLNARLWHGHDPIKVILSNQIKPGANICMLKENKTLIFNHKESLAENENEWLKMDDKLNPINEVIDQLYAKGIQSLIVEGGKKILDQFIDMNLWDEARVLTGSTIWNKGIKAPQLTNYKLLKKNKISLDSCTIYVNNIT
ncbi:bifunctional diaminohydroxyphosphoribosylaminopyrimidine deaminase/5-amino-6-(5-phosphoribosylamino)uracil reductase RibD [Flavobacteriaceae bacterium Ap0902]|nr:bifunctional diaminohydroxyphosphoribosylaminopyrimidine deaminase/5-amino-6-(5-phosphoribosylamino)uracil reductase RibD [Flavobacteriaceae bacterium Ap0902]